MAKEISAPLQDIRSMLDTVKYNLVNTQQPDSRAIDTSLKTDPIGGTGKYRTSIVNSRRDDPLKTKIFFSSITPAAKAQTKADSLSILQEAIGNASDPHKSLLTQVVTDFVAQAKVLQVKDDISVRRAFIDSGLTLATTLNGAIQKAKDLRLQADMDLRTGLQKLNTTLEELNYINQTLMSSVAPERLHDQRDRLIEEISKKVDVQVFFVPNGVAKVTLKGTGFELVSETGRAKFSYAATSSDNILNDTGIPDITVVSCNNKGDVVSDPVTVMGGSSNKPLRTMLGGEVEGWINLRDVDLLNAEKSFKSLAKGVAKAVNEIHNSGSPWPPQTSVSGTSFVSGQDQLDFQGEVGFFAVNTKGGQLKGGAGRLHGAKIDFSTFKGSGINGTVTAGDVIKEINQQLDLTPSRDRAAIGTIKDTHSAQMAGQYLVNNIQLAGLSDIDSNGNWKFDLDLQGNSFFGSKVEVLGVSSPTGGILPPAFLPPAFNLKKDGTERTGQAITLGGFIPGAPGTVDVTIALRVTGENGEVNEGTITFKVDQNPTKINQRTSYVSGQGLPAPTGDFVTSPLITSHSGVARAMLIDDTGNEITDLTSGERGNLVIQTSDPDYSVVIQGGNLSSLFGLNNFFEIDEATGEIMVKDKINQDVSMLSTGRVKPTDGVETTMTVGQDKAKADLVFGQNFQAGDTITIDGTILTLVTVPPVNSSQIQIGIDLPSSLQNLADGIAAHPLLKSKFTAVSDGATKLSITTRAAGTWGNNVQVSATVGGGVNLVSINNGVAAANVGPINLIGGTNVQQTIKVFDYTIGTASHEILADLQLLASKPIYFEGDGSASGQFRCTAQEFTTLVVGAVTEQYNKADSDSKVLNNALTALNKELTQLFAPDQYEQYYKALDLIEFMKVFATYGKMVDDTNQRVLDILFSS